MKFLTASIVAALSMISLEASAGADCQYRITGTDNITVTPAGFTGKMSCNKKQTEELVAAIAKGMAENNIADSVVAIGDLQSFWWVREAVAKELSSSKDWDATKGAKPEGGQGGAVTTAIIDLFEPIFNKNKLRVSSANLEQMSVEDAANQKFKGVKGKYPFTGKISLTITKATY